MIGSRNERDVRYLLAGSGLVAAAGFVALARAVARGDTDAFDRRARRKTPKRRQHPALARAAELAGPLGKWYVQGPVAAMIARRAEPRSRAAARAISLASATSAALAFGLQRALPSHAAPPGRHKPNQPSFPSKHALQTAAVGLTTAWALSREMDGPARVLSPAAALVPLAIGAGRMVLDRHWASDVVGGWVAGVAVAAGCALLYETLEDRRPLASRVLRRVRR
jgi:undecaprenyl-diphosphatase